MYYYQNQIKEYRAIDGMFLKALNPKYLNAKITAEITPYPYLLLTDFLSDLAINKLLYEIDRHHFEYNKDKKNTIIHAPMTYLPLLDIFCDEDFYNFIGEIFDMEISRKKDQVPSLRVLDKNHKIEIHNDIGYEGFGAVCFFYLSKWNLGNGGEVELFSKQLELKKVLNPFQNSVFIMPISSISFHRVAPIIGDFIRKVAFFPLIYRKVSYA